MNYIFRNPGLIDPRSITTFGVSSKESSAPIGYFGTGLKYAIAVILRTGGSICIYSGPERYEFSVQKTRIRVNDFDVVHMNGQPLGFTTELGKNWEQWQAFRELACNCMDEKGTFFETQHTIEHDTEHTTVVVRGAEFAKAWAAQDSVLLNSTPLWANDKVEFHPSPSALVYYRGVRVGKLSRPSLYTYNMTRNMSLTEDRTFALPWIVDNEVIDAIRKDVKNEQIIEAAVTALPDKTLEGNFGYYGECSDEFKTVVTRLSRMFHPRLNRSAEALVRDADLSVFIKDESSSLDSVNRQRLKQATAFCKRIGFPVDAYPLIVSSNLGGGILGRADNGKIYISTTAFNMGTKQVAGTLIEEYLHLAKGLIDCERSMQNYLIDTICSLGERLTKKPL